MLIFFTFLQNVQHNFKTLGLYQQCDICFKSVEQFVFITWLVFMSHPIKLLQWEVKDDCSFCWFRWNCWPSLFVWWNCWPSLFGLWNCWPSLFELCFSFFIMVYPRSYCSKKLLIFRHQQVTEKWRRKKQSEQKWL